MQTAILHSLVRLFEYYRGLGQKTMDQLPDDALLWQYNEESNSIAVIVKHLHGNMLSRWTDFLTSDGEKAWRERDGEFEATLTSRQAIQEKYDAGWDCLLNALRPLDDTSLDQIVYIRNEGHTVLEAIHRQLAHYAYHVGQIVYIGKQVKDQEWKTLSIARNASKAYNSKKFAGEQVKRHFTDEV